MQTFFSLTTNKIVELIRNARRRIVYLSPGITLIIAKEIVAKKDVDNIEVIIDSEQEIFRLGYGQIEGIELLMSEKIEIRKVKSLRIGVIIIDENAWIFSTPPLIVEEERECLINSVSVNLSQANDFVNSIVPQERRGLIQQLTLFAEEAEIGNDPYTQKDLSIAKKDLQECPPKQFDLERRVRTYSSFIQFVELRLIGIQLSRRTVQIPTKLLNVKNSKEVNERLKATYRLIDENSKISGKDIENKVQSLRKSYLRSMGNRLGTVILRNVKEEFVKEVNKLKLK